MSWLIALIVAANNGIVTGWVFDAADSTPLRAANVTVPGTELGTFTDSTGRYVLTGVSARRLRIEVSHVAFQSAYVTLAPADSVRRINLWLGMREIPMPSVSVRPARYTAPPASVEQLSAAEVRSLPGAEKDVFRAVQTLPGVTSSGDYFGWLHVRGGTPEENLVLLDGMEIPNPYHLSGLASIFNTQMVDRVDFSTGGFGPDYGDAVSSVMSVSTRAARAGRARVHVGLDMTELDATAEVHSGTLGGVVAGVRYSYLDQLLRRIDLGSNYLAPTYTDFHVKYDRPFGSGLRVSASLLRSRETAAAGDSGNWRAPSLRLDSDLWTAGLNAQWQPGEDVFVTGSVSALDSRTEMSVADVLGAHSRIHHPRKAAASASLRYRPGRETELSAGASAGWLDYYHKSNIPLEIIDPSRWGDSLAARCTTAQQGAYANVSSDLSTRLTAGAGVRLDRQNLDGTLLASPRAHASYRVGAGTTARVAWGIYRQFMAPEYRNADDSLGQPEPLLSRHAVAGIEQSLPAGISARLEVYDKTFDNIVTVNDSGHFVDDGSGSARGVELTVRQRAGDRLSWWATYAYSRTRRSWLHGADPVAADADQPHAANLAGSARLPAGFDLGVKLRIASGAPYTPERWVRGNHCYVGEHNSARYPLYRRLDLRVAHGFRVGRGRLEAYLSVLNVTNAHNVQSYYYDNESTRRAIYMIPRVPFLGVSMDW